MSVDVMTRVMARKYDAESIRDALNSKVEEMVLVQALEGHGDSFQLFQGEIKEVVPIYNQRGEHKSDYAVLFRLYRNGQLSCDMRTLGFSNQRCDIAGVITTIGKEVVFQESSLVERWEELYRDHRKKMNGSGDIHGDKTLLANHNIQVS